MPSGFFVTAGRNQQLAVDEMQRRRKRVGSLGSTQLPDSKPAGLRIRSSGGPGPMSAFLSRIRGGVSEETVCFQNAAGVTYPFLTHRTLRIRPPEPHCTRMRSQAAELLKPHPMIRNRAGVKSTSITLSLLALSFVCMGQQRPSMRWVLHVIPMSHPDILTTPAGPAVTHSSNFSVVTASKPAARGEILSLFATGLGPTQAWC